MTEIRTTSSTGGEKGVKPERYDLLPKAGLDAIARVFGFGATKYADHNWRKGYEWGKSYSALDRHIKAFWDGETYDPESGLPHIAHAGFHVLVLLTWLAEQGEGGQFDDRYRPPDDVDKFAPLAQADLQPYIDQANAYAAELTKLVEAPVGDELDNEEAPEVTAERIKRSKKLYDKLQDLGDAARSGELELNDREVLHGNHPTHAFTGRTFEDASPDLPREEDLAIPVFTASSLVVGNYSMFIAPEPTPETNTEALLRAAQELRDSQHNNEEHPEDGSSEWDLEYRHDQLTEAVRQYATNGPDAKPEIHVLGPGWKELGYMTEEGLNSLIQPVTVREALQRFHNRE